jgi:hypothetical protein
MKPLTITATIFSLIAIVYAIVQKGVADQNMVLFSQTIKMTDSLKIQLQQCKESTELNRKIAELETKRADSLSKVILKKK